MSKKAFIVNMGLVGVIGLLSGCATYDDQLQSANGGDAGAQYWIGKAYLKGDGIAKDDKIAEEWFVKSAKSGNQDAAYQLALLWIKNRDISRVHDLPEMFESGLQSGLLAYRTLTQELFEAAPEYVKKLIADLQVDDAVKFRKFCMIQFKNSGLFNDSPGGNGLWAETNDPDPAGYYLPDVINEVRSKMQREIDRGKWIVAENAAAAKRKAIEQRRILAIAQADPL